MGGNRWRLYSDESLLITHCHSGAIKLSVPTQYDTIIVNSGIYEVNGSELTLRPIVAKTPEYAGGSSTMEFRIDGDILTTTTRSITSVDGASPEGAIGWSMTLRRVQ